MKKRDKLKQMLLLFSHKLTENQKKDAKENWEIERFIALPEELQQLWSNVDPDLESLEDLLLPMHIFVQEELQKNDIVLIQGDFGASCMMAKFVKSMGMVPVYATTKRFAEEYIENGKNIKKSIFVHRRFRRYE